MKRKLNLGLLMLIGSFFLAVFLGMSFPEILKSFVGGIIDFDTIKIVVIIILIGIMGNLLNESGSLRKINHSFETFIKSRRLALVFPSLLMGLLPVPAGAMLSAPLVEESGSKMGLTPEQKTFLNYWFRHILEFVWPIYPGLILAATILNIPVYRLIMIQLPLALTAAVIGYVVGLSKISTQKKIRENKAVIIKSFFTFLLNAWPILAIIILVLVIKIDIIVSLSIIVVVAIFVTRVNSKRLLAISWNSLSWKTILLIISVMVFKKVLETSGVLPVIPQFFNSLRIPPVITLFTIPFCLGSISGLAMIVAGVTFPVLHPIIGMETPNLAYAMLAYVGGVSGYLLSPFHLCLVVSTVYFKASLARVWKMVIFPVICVDAVAFAIVLTQKLL